MFYYVSSRFVDVQTIQSKDAAGTLSSFTKFITQKQKTSESMFQSVNID